MFSLYVTCTLCLLFKYLTDWYLNEDQGRKIKSRISICYYNCLVCFQYNDHSPVTFMLGNKVVRTF